MAAVQGASGLPGPEAQGAGEGLGERARAALPDVIALATASRSMDFDVIAAITDEYLGSTAGVHDAAALFASFGMCARLLTRQQPRPQQLLDALLRAAPEQPAEAALPLGRERSDAYELISAALRGSGPAARTARRLALRYMAGEGRDAEAARRAVVAMAAWAVAIVAAESSTDLSALALRLAAAS